MSVESLGIRLSPLMTADSVHRTSPEDKGSVQNRWFCSVFIVEGPGHKQDIVYAGEVTINNNVVTLKEVVPHLKEFNIFKSIWPDGLHPRIHKETRDQLAVSLVHIFNLSMASVKVYEH